MQARVRKRKFRLFLYLFTISAFVGYFYFGLFPGALKDHVTLQIYDRLGYHISFSTVHYIPFKGFVLKDMHIEPTQQLPNGFYAESLSILPEWKRLLRRQISIKRIFAKSAYLNFSTPPIAESDIESQDDESDEDSFLESLGKKTSEMPLALLQTEIECIKCTILLPENNPLKINQLSKVDFKLSLTNPEAIPLQLSMKIGNDIKVRLLKGIYKPDLGQISLFSNGYLVGLPESAKKYLNHQPFQITTARGFYTLESMIQLPNLQSDRLSVDFKVDFDELHMSGGNNESTFDSVQKLSAKGYVGENSALQIETADIELLRASVTSKKISDPIHFDSGIIQYKNQAWDISDALFKWKDSQFKANLHLNGSPMIATGEIIQTSRNLTMWKPLFPDSFEGPIDYDTLEADITTRIVIDGPLKDLNQNIRTIQLSLQNGSVTLKSPFSQRLSHITGQIEVKNQRFQFKSLQFKCNGRPFSLSGDLDKSGATKSIFEVKSKNITVAVHSQWEGESVLLNNVLIQAPGLISNFNGVVTDLKFGTVNLEGRAEIVSHELKRTFRDLGFKSKLSALPMGTLQALFDLKGMLSDLNSLDGSIRIKSPFMTLMSFPLQDVEIDAEIKGKVLEIPYLKGFLSGGEIRGKGQVDFAAENNPYFQSHVFADKVDLAQFITWAGIDYKKAEGVLHLDSVLEGYLNQTDSIKGSGHFRALGGTIWETDRYSKLGSIPFLRIDGIQNVIFRSADGSFTVKNGRIVSEDIVLNSRHINLHLRGVMEIGGLLDFDLISRFSPALIKETQQLGNVASTVMRMAEEKISQYKVLGTLTSPILQENS